MTATVEHLMKSTQRLQRSWDDYVDKHDALARVLIYVRRMVLAFDLRGVEYLLATLAGTTGFWMGWPWNNLYKSATPTYLILCDYMPDYAWTLLFLAAGFPSIFFIGKSEFQRRGRIIGCGLLLSIWVLASILFITDQAPYLATAWTPVIAVYQAWVLLALLLRTPTHDATK